MSKAAEMDIADRLEVIASFYEQQGEAHAHLDAVFLAEAAAEIKRLRAGGCARDQRTTQYCAEASMLSRQLEVCKDAWINNVKATDLVRDQRDELERELERVKVALANAVSERGRLRRALLDIAEMKNVNSALVDLDIAREFAREVAEDTPDA